jgi:hypothetical protein
MIVEWIFGFISIFFIKYKSCKPTSHVCTCICEFFSLRPTLTLISWDTLKLQRGRLLFFGLFDHAYTPMQNGIVNWKNRTIVELVYSYILLSCLKLFGLRPFPLHIISKIGFQFQQNPKLHMNSGHNINPKLII